MKRVLIIFLMLSVLLSLIGCRGKHQCREAESSAPEEISKIA